MKQVRNRSKRAGYRGVLKRGEHYLCSCMCLPAHKKRREAVKCCMSKYQVLFISGDVVEATELV